MEVCVGLVAPFFRQNTGEVPQAQFIAAGGCVEVFNIVYQYMVQQRFVEQRGGVEVFEVFSQDRGHQHFVEQITDAPRGFRFCVEIEVQMHTTVFSRQWRCRRCSFQRLRSDIGGSQVQFIAAGERRCETASNSRVLVRCFFFFGEERAPVSDTDAGGVAGTAGV